MCILKVDNVCLGWVYSVSSPPPPNHRTVFAHFVCLSGFFLGGGGGYGGVSVFVLVPLTEISNNIPPCKDVKPT